MLVYIGVYREINIPLYRVKFRTIILRFICIFGPLEIITRSFDYDPKYVRKILL